MGWEGSWGRLHVGGTIVIGGGGATVIGTVIDGGEACATIAGGNADCAHPALGNARVTRRESSANRILLLLAMAARAAEEGPIIRGVGAPCNQRKSFRASSSVLLIGLATLVVPLKRAKAEDCGW
jgi:hypothetical protein